MDYSAGSVSKKGLVAQAAELAQRGVQLVDAWPVVEVSQWFEQVDNLAASADVPGGEAVATAALELAVYLSALVEKGLQASKEQRERARVLLKQLAEAGEVSDAGVAVVPRETVARSGVLRVVFYLRADDRELPGLVAQLARERFVVRSFSDLNRAIAEARNLPPDALVMDEGFASGLSRMLEALERGSANRRPPLVLALCTDGDVRQRLYAQRAGADLVLEGTDSLRIVESLMGLFLRKGQDEARVLIVDDDRSMAMFCASVLSHKGIGTKVVHLARDGLDALANYRPDLVLLDLYLPDMNGIEVAQLIRERPDSQWVPIVFLSGEEDVEQRFDAIRMGGDDFLSKPVKPRHLLSAVTSRLDRVRQLSAVGASRSHSQDLRHGRIDRATIVHEVERSRRGELGECVGLIMLSVDDVPALAKRLGFVRTGDLAQQIGTSIACESGLKSGICALGEFSFVFLMAVSNDGALHLAAESLRTRMSGRGWLAADSPVDVSFSLGGARADEPGVAIDDLFSGVGDVLRIAQERGGGRSEWVVRAREDAQWTPEVRLAHAILRRPLMADTTSFRFRPLAQLHGQLEHQFLVDFALVAPKASAGVRIDRDVFEPVARSLNALRAVDRWQTHALSVRAATQAGTLPELRFFYSMSTETLFDSAFPQWLSADLHGINCDSDVLVLVFEVSDLVEDIPRASRAFEMIQTTGVRIGLSGFRDCGRDSQRLCRLPSVYANLFDWSRPESGWRECRAGLIAESIKHGKLVVMRGVNDPAPLGELFRDGVHYVAGDAVGGFSDAPVATSSPVAG